MLMVLRLLDSRLNDLNKLISCFTRSEQSITERKASKGDS